ncbi:MAG: hypothetical protein IPN70_03045 [Candidatus Moraniibacteriota bacterium]|nr:MAG: hypothetical protein IPN70_03045 [Candidatus Moranbacteria bacterium]
MNTQTTPLPSQTTSSTPNAYQTQERESSSNTPPFETLDTTSSSSCTSHWYNPFSWGC